VINTLLQVSTVQIIFLKVVKILCSDVLIVNGNHLISVLSITLSTRFEHTSLVLIVLLKGMILDHECLALCQIEYLLVFICHQ
jgi:hypothetical protein